MSTRSLSSIIQDGLLALSVVAILLFIVNAAFANPLTDDYCYSSMARNLGFMPAQAYWYNHWTGRFLSSALLSGNPLVYGQMAGYKLIPLLLVSSLWAALYLAVRTVVRESLPARSLWVFVSVFVAVYLDRMPDIRSGLYWMAGSVTYQVGAILALFLVVTLARLLRATGQGRLKWCLVASLCALLIPGTNEVVLLMLFPLLLAIVAFDRRLRGRFDRLLFLPVACALAGALVSVCAPGNQVRMAASADHRDVWAAAVQAGFAAAKSALLWLGAPSVLILVVMVIVATCRNRELLALLRTLKPAMTLGSFGLLLVCGFFPTYWSLGVSPPSEQ